MVATINGNTSDTIISCYCPTNICEEMDLIAFYNELSYLVRSIAKHNVEIWMLKLVKTSTTNLADRTHQTEMGNI